MNGYLQALSIAIVVANLAAGLYGFWVWWRDGRTSKFWPLLRTAQFLAVISGVISLACLALGVDLPRLHLVYSLTPIGVAFFAEQLRISAGPIELDRHGLKGRSDLETLDTSQRQELARAIVRREVVIMAASAIIVAVLGLRAAQLI